MLHRLIWIAALCLPIACLAQVPDDLASKKDFRAGRASSASPTGKNDDYRPIAPGQTLTLADVRGSGRFTHLWMTIAAESPDHLRELVLRMTWDDAATPAVECPVGDFFAQGPGKYVEYHSAPVSVGGSMALNCYWPMPFKRHAVITVTNEGPKPVGAFYYNFDYRLENRPAPVDHSAQIVAKEFALARITGKRARDKEARQTLLTEIAAMKAQMKTPPQEVRYFHTQYRNYFPAPVGKALTICEVKGAGHFVGTVVTVLANSDGWWGEGDDIWHVDGSIKPDIFGTGSEDYFCGAWDFGHTFQTPYFGVTFYDNPDKGGEKRGIQNTVYRWHIQDMVPFTKSLMFELEHGRSGWDENRKPLTNHYTTLGLYYVDHPEQDGAPIPPYKSRIPTLLPLPG